MENSKRARSDEAKRKKRDMLLATARDLLATMAYESIKMQDIAKAAGVSKGTLFVYFESKDQLFLEILNEAKALRYQKLLLTLKTQEIWQKDALIQLILSDVERVIEDERVYMILLVHGKINFDMAGIQASNQAISGVSRHLNANYDGLSENEASEMLEALEAIMIGHYSDRRKTLETCRYYLSAYLQ